MCLLAFYIITKSGPANLFPHLILMRSCSNELALARQMQQTKAEMEAKKVAQEKQELVAMQVAFNADKNTLEDTKRNLAREYVLTIVRIQHSDLLLFHYFSRDIAAIVVAKFGTFSQDALRSEQQLLAAVKKVEEDAKRTFDEARKQFLEERAKVAADDAKAMERIESEKVDCCIARLLTVTCSESY